MNEFDRLNSINPNKLSWNTGASVANSFTQPLGNTIGSSWNPSKSKYTLIENTPIDYNLSSALAPNNGLGVSTESNWYDGFTDLFKNSDGSWNLQGIGAGIQGLGSLASAFGNLYMGNKALKFAKDQFNFQKDLANTNLNNSIKSYNTKLGDIANTRSVMETGSTGKYDNWYNDNKLSR